MDSEQHLFLLGSNHRREKLLVSSALPRTRDLPDDEEEKDGLPHHHHHTTSHHVTVDGRSFRSWVAPLPPSRTAACFYLPPMSPMMSPMPATAICSACHGCHAKICASPRLPLVDNAITVDWEWVRILSDPRVPEGLPSLCTVVTPSSPA